MNIKHFAVLALLLVATCWIKPARSAESYDNCTGFVASVPATISTQGVWCMTKDLATSIATGSAINITVPNVTLECNDFKLGGLGAGIGTTATGINGSRINLTIRNCNVRGFRIGLNLAQGASHLVEHNRFDGNTWIGIAVEGDGSVIRDNRVMDTGGTTTVGNNVKAVGIYTEGDVEILANLVTGVVAAAGSNGAAMGINPIDNLSGSVIENQIKNVLGDGTGFADAISFFGMTGRVSVDSNNIIGAGAANSSAVYCPASNQVMLVGNVAAGWGVTTVNCAFDDGNVVH